VAKAVDGLGNSSYSIATLIIHKEHYMNQVIYLVGLVVVVMAVLSFVGLR